MEQLPSILGEEERKRIRPERLEALLSSPLGGRLRAAQDRGELYREQHFMLRLPHDELFPDSNSKEPVLLQGIMDAFFFEEDGICLIDYKSDHVSSGEVLKERYEKQLRLYAMALNRITRYPVKECLIVSLVLGETIRI